ncbi:hypothetical protein GPECTOR_5g467 [Gonium pectorale]|uniref:FHA domain-containing protein n=1 Tax=Gonium pectorale TaxID=33097 RepID=A0A150GX46_GONPE|nr:hypothetical protein GPECTOR_5g467 [Gonium pectorale]|eukprot:KXZ54389.1 hypothetical protein GPECTOR_5g467 [Gonium pectorale]
MGEERRRRSDSRSPVRPRGEARGGREGDRETGRRYDREREHDRDRERAHAGDRDRHRDRDWDREKGYARGGPREDGRDDGGARPASTRVKEEPRGGDGPAGPRGGQLDQERDRRPEREPEDWGSRGGGGGGGRGGDGYGRGPRNDDSGEGAGGMKRERERSRDRDGDGGRGGRAAGRGPKRERGQDDWGGGGGRGGGGGGGRSDSRYMSREEREDKEREAEEAAKPKAPKEQPNLGLSGKLAAETNKVAGGTVLKHVPPADAKMPDKRWRLYVFKNEQLQDEPYRLHKHDHFLFGRDVHVADIITAHVSCSKQHAVLQYRLTAKEDEWGLSSSAVRPYLLDLGSVNGTFLNGERLEALRYYELLEKDVIKFGQSSREYVLLHDKSGDE